MDGYDLRLMSWGDGSGVPTLGDSLVIVGTDTAGLLHIRIFNAGGNRVTDTDETQLPGSQAGAISALKQRKAQVLQEVTSILGQPRMDTPRGSVDRPNWMDDRYRALVDKSSGAEIDPRWVKPNKGT